MSKLRKIFSDKDWEQCCGSFCKDCDIATSYKKKFGKKEGEKKFNKDYKRQSK